MKTAALINSDLVPPIDGFIKAPTASRKAKATKKPAPFKIRWLRQIAGDRTLTTLAVQTAILLADYYDDETGCAWPSQVRLAAELRATRAGVRLAIKRLEDAKYVEYVAQRGRPKKGAGAANNNRYFLRCPEAESVN
jgi:hypothetical protein